MKQLLLALLPATLLFTGCENACEKGFELKSRLQILDNQIAGTILTPSNLSPTCIDVRKTWTPELARGSEFAARVAHEYFYSEDSTCLRGHNERECRLTRDPRTLRPRRVCLDIFMCDATTIIAHKHDGFDQAMELSALLADSGQGLGAACIAHDQGADAQAIFRFAGVRHKIGVALRDTDYVLTKAGCYDHSGN